MRGVAGDLWFGQGERGWTVPDLSCVLLLVWRFISRMQLLRYPRSHVLAQSSLYVAHDVCCVPLFPENDMLKNKNAHSCREFCRWLPPAHVEKLPREIRDDVACDERDILPCHL